MDARFSVSRQNELYAEFSNLGAVLLPVDTFVTNVGALANCWRIPMIKRDFQRCLTEWQPHALIELMPHVWSSPIASVVKAAGVRYVTLIHDADPHPGDYRSAAVERMIHRALRQADTVLTLSEAVANRIKARNLVAAGSVYSLFLPDLKFGGSETPKPPRLGEPFRLAFFGRIMPYKGLPLFLDMIDALRKDGVSVEFGVFGEGPLGSSAQRLSRMGAQVINRWLTDDEIGKLLASFHAVVLSHIEASQSGVAAAAFGAGLPVIATPVGGIVEQVQDNITGVLSTNVDALALADAAKRLIFDQALYELISRNIAETKSNRSISRFVKECVSYALYEGRPF